MKYTLISRSRQPIVTDGRLSFGDVDRKQVVIGDIDRIKWCVNQLDPHTVIMNKIF